MYELKEKCCFCISFEVGGYIISGLSTIGSTGNIKAAWYSAIIACIAYGLAIYGIWKVFC